jgi:hypothetical protein
MGARFIVLERPLSGEHNVAYGVGIGRWSVAHPRTRFHHWNRRPGGRNARAR